MDIGDKIRTLRADQNLTLEEVAKVCGVGKSTVRKWEQGIIQNMRRDKIDKLAKALHVTPAYLMGWEDNKKKEPAAASYELTSEEIELLENYRSAPPEGKAVIAYLLKPR